MTIREYITLSPLWGKKSGTVISYQLSVINYLPLISYPPYFLSNCDFFINSDRASQGMAIFLLNSLKF